MQTCAVWRIDTVSKPTNQSPRICFIAKIKSVSDLCLSSIKSLLLYINLFKFLSMKLGIIITASILTLCSADSSPYPPTQSSRNGLNFSESVQQAKDQMRYFFAREKPVNDSIDKLENYYADVKEKDMGKVYPRRRLRRPCKVLPDPQPGLVNPKLIAPLYRYKPLRRDEKFYGKFAPPISYEMAPSNGVDANNMVVGTLPPVSRSYPAAAPELNSPTAGPIQNPYAYPVIQKQTVYAPNPFFDHKDDYNAENDYFHNRDPNEIVETGDSYQRSRDNINDNVQVNQFNTNPNAAIAPSNWQANLNNDYSQRMSLLSAELASNSAAMASMSWIMKMASMSSQFAQREASLQAQILSMSAASTAISTTKGGWQW